MSNANLLGGTGGSGGVSIGDPIPPLNGSQVLFTDAAGNLAQDLDFFYDDGVHQLTLGGGTFNALFAVIGETQLLTSGGDTVFIVNAASGGIIFNPNSSATVGMQIFGRNFLNPPLMWSFPSGDTITFGDDLDLGGTVGISSLTTLDTALIIRAIASQTGHLTSWQAGGLNQLLGVNVSGELECGSTSQGVKVSGATTGIWTIGGYGNTNNENITFDFESVANQVSVSTSTGVNLISFGINISAALFTGATLANDNIKHTFGTGSDTFIQYTGTVWDFDIAQATTEIVFNNSGFDTDFRIESDGFTDIFFVDASTNRIGIHNSSPVALLSIQSALSSTDYATCFHVGTGTVGLFAGNFSSSGYAPGFLGQSVTSTNPGLAFIGRIGAGEDTGTRGVYEVSCQNSVAGSIVTRPLVVFSSGATQKFTVMPSGFTAHNGQGTLPTDMLDLFGIADSASTFSSIRFRDAKGNASSRDFRLANFATPGYGSICWYVGSTAAGLPSNTALWVLDKSGNQMFNGGNTVPTAKVHIGAGTATASTAPLKFTTGTSLTSAEAGAMEFTTDDLFFTITTGTARKRLLMADPSGGLTSGRVPFATTNGRLTDDADLTFVTDTLTATKVVGTTSIKVGTAAGYLSSDGSAGATGTFTTVDLKTVTVKDGIITAIV